MEHRFNTIEFCKFNYPIVEKGVKGEYDDYQMFSDIQEFIRFALRNGYQMRIWADENSVVIEYDYHNEELMSSNLEWIGNDEYITRENDNER